MEVRCLVDAGPLIGWLNASDQWHDWAVKTLSEVHRDAKIISTDRRDFTIYRRFGRQRLPVFLPPA
ncbi:MAG: hypothetical protein ACNA8L_13570 [Luteolibacter sp.]